VIQESRVPPDQLVRNVIIVTLSRVELFCAAMGITVSKVVTLL